MRRLEGQAVFVAGGAGRLGTATSHRLKLMYERDLGALDIDIEAWELTLRTNLTGHLACVRRALPAMIEAGDGAIVLTSSGAAHTAETIRLAYAVSKAGINQLVRHLAHTWGKQGIRANAVAPGPVLPDDFPNMDDYKAAMRSHRVGHGKDIAAMVAMLLSDDGEWINGQIISVDGGMSMRQ